MNFKKISLLWMVTFAAFFLFSCDDDDKPNNIRVLEVEFNSLKMVYPTEKDGKLLDVRGGDENYSVECSDNSVLQATIITKNKVLKLIPLMAGKVQVTITDQSDHSYVLNVDVSYKSEEIIIKQCLVRINGIGLTEDQKQEITEKAMEMIPVKPNGGYQFTYSNADGVSGTAKIFPQQVGGPSIPCAFVYGVASNQEIQEHYYEITAPDRTYVFVRNATSIVPKSEIITPESPNYLMEDITSHFKADYDGVEAVLTIQEIVPLSNQ